MDTANFIDITDQAFGDVGSDLAYEINPEDDDDMNRDLGGQCYFYWICQEDFRLATVATDYRIQVPVFKAMENALRRAFCDSPHNVDKPAIRRVLSRWRDIFATTFSYRLFKLPRYMPYRFYIWDFITPTIRMNDLIRILDTYITITSPIDIRLPDTEVCERMEKRKQFRKMTREAKSRDNKDVVHVCPYCEKIDSNHRQDHVADHMILAHYTYEDHKKYEENLLSTRHHQRIKASVLLNVIKNERRLVNCMSDMLCAMKNSTAELQGRDDVFENNAPLDVEGGLARALNMTGKSKQQALARILVNDRGVTLPSMRAFEAEIDRKMRIAWKEAYKQGRGLFNWNSI